MKEEVKYVINRKARKVIFSIGEAKAEMSLDEADAFVWLVHKKVAKSHRA